MKHEIGVLVLNVFIIIVCYEAGRFCLRGFRQLKKAKREPKAAIGVGVSPYFRDFKQCYDQWNASGRNGTDLLKLPTTNPGYMNTAAEEPLLNAMLDDMINNGFDAETTAKDAISHPSIRVRNASKQVMAARRRLYLLQSQPPETTE